MGGQTYIHRGKPRGLPWLCQYREARQAHRIKTIDYGDLVTAGFTGSKTQIPVCFGLIWIFFKKRFVLFLFMCIVRPTNKPKCVPM